MTWHLRLATAADIDNLFVLTQKPEVYRFLYDGMAPARDAVSARYLRGYDNQSIGGGLWLLESAEHVCAGAVELQPDAAGKIAEISYFLDPDFWGQGLAVRISWSVMQHAFEHSSLDEIFAGADEGNKSSFAVMRRLGMRFHREVQYPLGLGLEFIRSRHDPAPDPLPATIPIAPIKD